MGKDPAFLFYSSDFLTGTMLMSDAEVGRYMRLLCLQHQKGHLSEAEVFKISKRNEKVLSKFLRDKEGFYYNKRMDEEMTRRAKHSENQRENAYKRWGRDRCDGNAMAMPLENANANINIKKDKGVVGGEEPTLEQVKEFAKEINALTNPDKFYHHYKSAGWKVNGEKIEDWKSKFMKWEEEEKEKRKGEKPRQNQNHLIDAEIEKMKGTIGKAKHFERPTENYDYLAVDVFADDFDMKHPKTIGERNKPKD